MISEICRTFNDVDQHAGTPFRCLELATRNLRLDESAARLNIHSLLPNLLEQEVVGCISLLQRLAILESTCCRIVEGWVYRGYSSCYKLRHVVLCCFWVSLHCSGRHCSGRHCSGRHCSGRQHKCNGGSTFACACDLPDVFCSYGFLASVAVSVPQTENVSRIRMDASTQKQDCVHHQNLEAC